MSYERESKEIIIRGGDWIQGRPALIFLFFFNATDLINILVREHMKVVRFPITGYWIDIGQHTDLKKAQELVKHIKYV